MINEAPFDSSEALGAGPDVVNSNWVVMKFGGTSVSSADNWASIADLIRKRLDAGLKPVIVHSALSGVSNALEALLDSTLSEDPREALESLRARHYELAAELDLDGPALLDESLDELDQLFAGVRLLREASVRVRVRIMALGELMSTQLGAAYLKSQGIPVAWVDARDLLTSVSRSGTENSQDYLSAVCHYDPDPALRDTLSSTGDVILTQGFIARNRQNRTVLLGRGGSDTSAAYLAARLQARRIEVWTDVPGMFTADPRIVPSARLLTALRYDEAQELASAGSSVLHPRCLSPLRHFGIPLFVRCTARPELLGTTVAAVIDDSETQVKGICSRDGLTLVSMDSVGMWHEVGFLARAFAVFSEHQLSIDLVSTSETNVTVSIDAAAEVLTDDVRDALAADLSRYCRVRMIDDCTAVSLVGRKIRTILPRLAPALEVFEEERIHLMSQSANDLNLTFVVDKAQGTRLVRKLHASIIRKRGGSPSFGASWEALFAGEDEQRRDTPTPWWRRKREQLLEIAAETPNAYVYDIDSVRSAARQLKALGNVDRVLYAMKANFNADILRCLNDEGIDFECVSPGEVEWLESVIPDLDVLRLLFTPNFAPREEYDWALKRGLQVTLDNLYPLQTWPEIFAGARLFVRLDPGQGRGHHEHVKTAGVHSKFGIPLFELEELKQLADKAGAEIVGMHAHSGSGILDPSNWRSVAAALIDAAQMFPTVKSIDLGGGFGVPEKPGDKPLDLSAVDALLAEVRESYPQYQLWIEPGRFFVAQSGVLLTHVTQVKGKGEMKYIGVGTGMNSLIRPALYGAYHEIVNLSRADEAPSETVTVVGPICETGDRLGSDRLLPASSEGDVVLIANAGAYGRVMSSEYNRRKVAEEIAI
ncbi:MAG: bifunctional aspartate kinase/diaminopimelate decarboxylase [Pseudomonadota bacterium]